MSVVTNLILTTCSGGLDSDALSQVNEFFDGQRGLVSCDDSSLERGWYGGCKMLECDMAIGAFNHINLNSLLVHLKDKVRWREDYDFELLQLIVKEQDDDRFRIINVAEHVPT